jgi:hypothetical protein
MGRGRVAWGGEGGGGHFFTPKDKLSTANKSRKLIDPYPFCAPPFGLRILSFGLMKKDPYLDETSTVE